MYGWYIERWWTEEIAREKIDCTDEELEAFLENSRILILHFLPEPDNHTLPTVAGFVSYITTM